MKAGDLEQTFFFLFFSLHLFCPCFSTQKKPKKGPESLSCWTLPGAAILSSRKMDPKANLEPFHFTISRLITAVWPFRVSTSLRHTSPPLGSYYDPGRDVSLFFFNVFPFVRLTSISSLSLRLSSSLLCSQVLCPPSRPCGELPQEEVRPHQPAQGQEEAQVIPALCVVSVVKEEAWRSLVYCAYTSSRDQGLV